MRITAQKLISHREIRNHFVTPEILKDWTRRELLFKINEKLLEFEDFFHEEDDEDNSHRKYEATFIVLSMETYRDIGKELHALGLNPFRLKQLQSLLIDKPTKKDEK